MSDWFDNGMEQLHKDIAEKTGVSLEAVKTVYCFLSSEGYIDYDTEKELIWDTYGGEDKDE